MPLVACGSHGPAPRQGAAGGNLTRTLAEESGLPERVREFVTDEVKRIKIPWLLANLDRALGFERYG
jgi:hypothetical protein